jgi:hypothetical protein
MSSKLRQTFRRLRDATITAPPMVASKRVVYSRPPHQRADRSSSRRKDDERPATEVTMKVQTDVKAGGLLSLVAIVIVDVNFGGCCGSRKGC